MSAKRTNAAPTRRIKNVHGKPRSMPDWGAIVKVQHQIVGKVPWRVLDELMEELSEYAAIAGCKEQTISVRLFVTSPDRNSAMDQALTVVLAALRALESPHDADSACILAADPMAEFERDFPAPE